MIEKVRLPITEEQADSSAEDLKLEIERLAHELTQRDHALETLKSENAQLLEKLKAVNQGAFEEGYRKGLEAGYQDGIERAGEQKEQYLQVLRTVEREVNEWSEVLYSQLTAITMASLYKILGEHLISSEVALSAIRHVLSQIGHQDCITVRVSPANHKYISQLESTTELASKVRYIADDQVQLGGCIVEPDRGLLDGRIETQLKTLEEVLYDAIGGSNHAQD